MNKYIYLVFLFFVGLFASHSQITETNISVNLSDQVFLNQSSLTTLDSRSIKSGLSDDTFTIIRQIGDNNVTNTNTVGGLRDINYLQVGTSNLIESYSNINYLNENIIQNGNNNRILNYSFGSIEDSSLNIIQSGNNLYFEKFGTNNQTNNLSLFISGDNRSVIVRSY